MSPVLEEINAKEGRLAMTPMIDVTFLILIFFMCTLEFRTLDGKLSAYLPKDRGPQASPAVPEDRVDVRVAVLEPGSKRDPYRIDRAWSGSGAFQFGPDRVIGYRLGPREIGDLDELSRGLVQAHLADNERGLTIDPRDGVVNADVMRVLDAAIAAGFSDITFRAAE